MADLVCTGKPPHSVSVPDSYQIQYLVTIDFTADNVLIHCGTCGAPIKQKAPDPAVLKKAAEVAPKK